MKAFGTLRRKFDGSDSFMSGHQIKNSAGATQHARRLRRIPVWALDDRKLREILLRAFPRLSDDPEQRAGASRWARIVNLYFRMGSTTFRVSEELDLTVKAVENILWRMNKTANREMKPRGRKRNTEGIGVTGGGTLTELAR